ncbi:MAG: NADPH-dependent assimilatory sulfite reductase hemoprotein subunit [Proteobacteria bacterium]|nr:NADPH-dependent assimilatory sulfite reductase hemoprotein subunit [Pseudomonadota bacterium]
MGSHSVEAIKAASGRLRGTIGESLADPLTGALREDDRVLLKFHGSYQQDDRDVREERRLAKLEPDFSFMIRIRTPGGLLTPEQWLALDAIARAHAQRGLRITTRQTIQFHGVQKHALKTTMQAIDASGIDTIAACGDVNRNIVVAANPASSGLHAQVHAQAAALAVRLLPRTRAWHETWLDAPPGADSGSEHEPHYGATYLPRKFKIGFAIPPWNDIDVFAQDLGFIAVIDDAAGALVGYDVVIGGGMGATHGDATTYPRLATTIGSITPDHVEAVALAVLTTQRDHGDRDNRQHARLKYTLDDRGVAWFRGEVERRAGLTFAPPRAVTFADNGDRFGWSEDANGRWNLGLRIPAGRVLDEPGAQWQSGLRAVAESLLAGTRAVHKHGCVRGELGEPDTAGDRAPMFRLTANQNLVIAGVTAAQRSRIDALLRAHGIDLHRRAGPVRLHALACVALPTCGLAMAEAERYLPTFVERIEALLEEHDLDDAPIHLRISGCPNGCSRPYLGEIALVGKAPGRYNLLLGADHRGQRLNVLYRENVDEAAILAALDPLFSLYADERDPGERFGDFLLRAGVIAPPRQRKIPTPLEVSA